jgi:hypothetical protein
MKHRNAIIVFLILIGASLACDGGSRIGGTVVDTGGRPVENASVLFEAVEKGEPRESYQCTARTSVDGIFGCGFVHAPWNVRLRLTVEKEGYTTYVRELNSSDLAKSPSGNMGSQVITLARR